MDALSSASMYPILAGRISTFDLSVKAYIRKLAALDDDNSTSGVHSYGELAWLRELGKEPSAIICNRTSLKFLVHK